MNYKQFIAAMLFSASLYAGGSHTNLYIGQSTVEDADAVTSFGLGWDFIKTMDSGLEWGLGADAIYLSEIEGISKTTYNLNVGLEFGYNFEPTQRVPISIRGFGGYGYGILGDNFITSGPVYGANAEYNFNEHFGAGIQYLIQDFEADHTDFDITLPFETSSLLFYLTLNLSGRK